MNTEDFILKLFGILDELVVPALVAWGLWMMRQWLAQWMKDDE